MRRSLLAGAAAAALATTAIGGSAMADQHHPQSRKTQADPSVHLKLTPSTPQLAACMPRARLKVTVDPTVDQVGFDSFRIKARHLAPNRDYTVFLLEQAGAPFGAAEYIGDFSTNKWGYGQNTFKLIVSEAFSSTLVNGQRVRVDLNRVGVWFADPADDDFCAATPGTDKVTPFDGDNEAGVQAFNSANAQPLPAP
jgi:hypothetical protein